MDPNTPHHHAPPAHPVTRRHLLGGWGGTALTGAALAACARGEATPAPGAAPQLKPATIEYWHVFGGTDKPTMDHMLDAFRAAFPAITVQDTQVGFGKMKEKVTVGLASGTPPNLFQSGDAFHAAAYGVLRQAKPVDAFARRDRITADLFIPAVQPTILNAGKLWGLRFNTDVRVLFYNTEAFQEAGLSPDKPPVSWDDLIDYAHKLTKKGGDGGLERAGWWPATGEVWFQQLHWSNGGQLADDAGTKLLFDDPTGVNTLEFVAKAADAVAPAAQYAEFAKGYGTNENDPFIAGKLAMIFHGSWLKATYDKYGGNLKYRAALLPYPKKQLSISGGFSLVVPAASPGDKDEAAWQLMRFLCTDKEQQLFMTKTGQLSALVALQNDPFFQSDPVMAVVAKQMQSSGNFTWQPTLAKLGSSCAAAKNGAIAKSAAPKDLLDQAARDTQADLDDFLRQHPEWTQNFGK